MIDSSSNRLRSIVLFLMCYKVYCDNVTSIDDGDATTVVKVNGNTTLTPSSMTILNQILKNLEDFGDHRIKELDSLSAKQSKLSIGNISISDQILSLRDGLSSLKPIKKTFGYKVTVVRSPITEEKPLVFKEFFDSEEPVNDTNNGDLSSSNSDSHHSVVPVPPNYVANSEPRVVKKVGDHGKKFEESLLKTHHHDRGLSEGKTKILKHDAENHGSKYGHHHHQENKNSHNRGEYGHDKGGISQTGVRERTQIEFFEKEHFLDTEHDKAKGGHENVNGHTESKVQDKHSSQQHQKTHSDHDSHSRHKHVDGAQIVEPHYSDLRGHVNHYGHPAPHQKKEHVVAGENGARTHHSNQESSKHSDSHGKHHSSENNEDRSYYNKDKGRTKEGYRERGYKITTEREYFLKDAHHDTGFGKHNKGHQASLLDKGRHGSEGGERHRDFKKVLQHHDAHDVASDKKVGHHQDIEHHHDAGYVQNQENHPKSEYLQGSSSGNYLITQKREGELSENKNTKCKTCCRKYANAKNFTSLITPRRIGDQQNVTEIKLDKRNSTDYRSTGTRNPIFNRDTTNKNNFLRSEKHQNYLNNRRRMKGKIVRLRVPTRLQEANNSSSYNTHKSKLKQDDEVISHLPKDIIRDKSEKDIQIPHQNRDLYHSVTDIYPKVYKSNRTKNNPEKSVAERKSEAFAKYKNIPRLNDRVLPIPFLTLYGVTGKSLRYVNSKSRKGNEKTTPITRMPISEVRYVDDDPSFTRPQVDELLVSQVKYVDDEPTTIQSILDKIPVSVVKYVDEKLPQVPPKLEKFHRLKMRPAIIPKSVDGTYGAKVTEELPTYRDDPNYDRTRKYHQPIFGVTSTTPDPSPEEHLIGIKEDEANREEKHKYSQPLLPPDTHIKHGIWYPEKL
ncbi:uncharacterized protein LOC111631810 [Centruroides sculpturatus]|uniref:uncharacterized protein LOC111631810 n=1 Tax=Centruroides sculpturatus TaxID=218467 RepID=UPI000C6E0F45|nr:uncharacterized protein LOC111631810 [Centruroides sculpturatus]